MISAVITKKNDAVRLCSSQKTVGISFVITNYFCGNKSVFAVLNNLQRMAYSSGRLPCKNRTASGDFLSVKMRSNEKCVFIDDFLQTR